MKCLARRHEIDHLNTANFDHSVAGLRIKTSGFCIEDDFTHYHQCAPLKRQVQA